MQRWSPEELPAPVATDFQLLCAPSLAAGASAFRADYVPAGVSDPLALLAPAQREAARARLRGELEAESRAREEAQQRQREAQGRLFGEKLAAALEAEARTVLATAARASADLAVTLAERIVRRVVAVDREVLTRAVEDLLQRLRAGAPLTLTVHPEDAAWLEAQPELRARLRIATVQPDRRVARGGCVALADRREWDATIAGQLAALGEAVAQALEESALTGGGAADEDPAAVV